MKKNLSLGVFVSILLIGMLIHFNLHSVKGLEDLNSPDLASFDFNPKTIDVSSGSQSVIVNLRIKDEISGFHWGELRIRSPSGSIDRVKYIYPSNIISGNAQDGVYETTWVFPQYSYAGTWIVSDLIMHDVAGNIIHLATPEFSQEGFPIQLELISDPDDTISPELISFTFSPQTIDVSSGSQSVNVNLRITDELSGFDNGMVRINSPSGQQSVGAYIWPIHRISGDIHDGIYETAWDFPQSSEFGTWKLYHINFNDKVGNVKNINETKLIELGFPTELEVQDDSIPDWRKDIQPGDILLHRSDKFNPLAMFVEWTHAGIYVGNDLVVEAKPEGINYYPITNWDFPNDKMVVLLQVTTASENQREAAASWAENQVERRLHSLFPIYQVDWTNKQPDPNSLSWYCSELVWAAYYQQGINIDFDDGPYDPHYLDIFGYSVSPDDIYLDDDTEPIDGHQEVYPEFEEEFREYLMAGATIISKSPVDLIITDPDNLNISSGSVEIPIPENFETLYIETDLNRDGSTEDLIFIPERKEGDYLITVISEPKALPTDTYTLEIEANGINSILADNIQIENIPILPYLVRSTDIEITPLIPTIIDFNPTTLNLQSNGKWVTAYIELPIGHGYGMSEIDVESIKLNKEVSAELKPIEINDYDNDGISDLMIKFSKSVLRETFEVGDKVTITISGNLFDGRKFEGKVIIRVISEP